MFSIKIHILGKAVKSAKNNIFAVLYCKVLVNHTFPKLTDHCTILQVRTLEQQNKLMEAEIEAYHNRFVKPTGLRMLYEEQLKELRRIADQMRMQRVRMDFTIQTYRKKSAKLK